MGIVKHKVLALKSQVWSRKGVRFFRVHSPEDHHVPQPEPPQGYQQGCALLHTTTHKQYTPVCQPWVSSLLLWFTSSIPILAFRFLCNHMHAHCGHAWRILRLRANLTLHQLCQNKDAYETFHPSISTLRQSTCAKVIPTEESIFFPIQEYCWYARSLQVWRDHIHSVGVTKHRNYE